jgi:hypothetical protein
MSPEVVGAGSGRAPILLLLVSRRTRVRSSGMLHRRCVAGQSDTASGASLLFVDDREKLAQRGFRDSERRAPMRVFELRLGSDGGSIHAAEAGTSAASSG